MNCDILLLESYTWFILNCQTSDLCPRAVNTFFESYNFKEKIVIPFATSGGSTIGNSIKDLVRLYPDINWKEGKLLNSSKQAAEWAKSLAL